MPGDIPRILGEPVAAAERCAWGFTNDTSVVTLASGRRVVVQRLARGDRAAHTVALAQMLPPRLAAVGVCAPRVLAADLSATPPLIVYEYLRGDPAPQLLGTPAGAARLAAEMGRLLPRLARAATDVPDLARTWAHARELERAARRWLAGSGHLLGEAARQALAATIDAIGPSGVAGAARLAHGDFCPVNALVSGDEVVALIDLERACVAGPLFDAAWWGWVVRHHHPAAWEAAWPTLLASAGLPAGEETATRVAIIQRLRCLETLDDARRSGQPTVEMWARRLEATIAWG